MRPFSFGWRRYFFTLTSFGAIAMDESDENVFSLDQNRTEGSDPGSDIDILDVSVQNMSITGKFV